MSILKGIYKIFNQSTFFILLHVRRYVAVAEYKALLYQDTNFVNKTTDNSNSTCRQLDIPLVRRRNFIPFSSILY